MNDDLHVQITADASSAVDSVNVSQEAMDRLTTAIGQLTAEFGTLTATSERGEAALQSTGAAADSTGAKIAAVGVNAERAGVGFDTFTQHAYMLQRGMEAAGLSAEASAVKIGAMSDAMAGFAEAVPGVLLLVGALSALAAGFTFLKDGVQEAQQTQNAMNELQIAVRQNGQAWEDTRTKVEDWAKALADLSGIAESETIPMLTYLVQNGQSVSGAMSEVTIAADAVAAGMVLVRGAGEGAATQMMEFKQVMRALQEAESGHYTMLERIDAQLTPLIEKHASLSEILTKLNSDTQNAIDKNHGLAAEEARVHGEMSVMGETIGSIMLPELANLERGIAVIIDALGHMGNAFSEMASGAVKSIEGVLTMVGGLATALFDLNSGNWKNIGHDVQEAIEGGNEIGRGTKAIVDGIGEAWTKASAAVKTYAQDYLHAASEIHAAAGNVGDIVPDYSAPGKTGKAGKAGGGGPAPFTFNAVLSEQVKQQIDDYQTLIKSLDALPKSVEGYQSALSALSLALNQAHAQEDQEAAAVATAQKAADDATQAYNAFGKEIASGVIPNTKENQAILKGLNDERVRANAVLSQEQGQLRQTTTDVKDLTDAYTRNQTAIENSEAALTKQLDEEWQKRYDAYQKSLDEQWKAQQEFDNKAEKDVENFVDQIVVQHKSLASVLKQVYDDILKAFIDMCVKMIMESTILHTALSWLFGAVGGGSVPSAFAPGGQGVGAGVGAGVPVTGISSSVSGAGGGGLSAAVAGGAALAMSPATASSSGSYSSGYGSSSYGGPGGTSDTTFNAPGSPSGATRGGGFGLGSLSGAGGFPFGASISGPGGAASLGSYGLAGAGGALAGQLIEGGKGYADLGGAIGAMAGLYLAGPVGAVAGALWGSFIGSLFGDHFNPADEPDIYQQDAWGQENADMQGMTQSNPMTANGKKYVMDSWTSQMTNDKGWNVILEQFVSQFRGNTKVLPPDLQSAFPQIEALWGGATNQQYFNSNGKNGNLQIGSGQMALWTDFWGYVKTYGAEIAQLMQMYSASDLYSASLNGTASQMGSYAPSGSPWIMHDFPDVGSAPSGGGENAAFSIAGGSSAPVTNINVYQQFGGSLIAERAMDQRVKEAIAGQLGFRFSDMNGMG